MSQTATPADNPFDVPSSAACVVSDIPQPTPIAEVQPKDYPLYPDSLTATSAERYAARYEEVYQYNSYLAIEGSHDTSQLSVHADASDYLTEATGDGFLVGVDGELSVMQDEIVADNPVVGVYYLAPRVGLRCDISEPTLYDVESLQSVTVENRQTIYCGETADDQ